MDVNYCKIQPGRRINLAAGFVFAVSLVCPSVLFLTIYIAERTDGDGAIIIRIFVRCSFRGNVEFTMFFSFFLCLLSLQSTIVVKI